MSSATSGYITYVHNYETAKIWGRGSYLLILLDAHFGETGRCDVTSGNVTSCQNLRMHRIAFWLYGMFSLQRSSISTSSSRQPSMHLTLKTTKYQMFIGSDQSPICDVTPGNNDVICAEHGSDRAWVLEINARLFINIGLYLSKFIHTQL